MDSPLKSGTKEAIGEIINSGHRVVMITGDNPYTALCVARGVGMVAEEESGFLIGSEMETLDDSQLKEKMESVRVFARVTPVQKERLIAMLISMYQNVGKVLMCGDGTNDVGVWGDDYIYIHMRIINHGLGVKASTCGGIDNEQSSERGERKKERRFGGGSEDSIGLVGNLCYFIANST